MNPRTKTRYTGVLAMLAAVAAIGATVTVPVPADAATPNGAPSATTINGVAWDDVDADGVNDADTDGPVTGGNATALVLAGSLVALLGLCLLIAGRRRRPL